MMVFAAARPSYLFASSHEGVPDDGTRSCPVDAGTSSYVYDGGGPHDYDESGLTDRFSNIVHAADQPLWDGLQPISIRISPSSHTLPRDYYNTKKLVKDLGLPVEKIHACKNGCMLYWKDDIDLEYCKFCGDGRYKPARGRDPHRKRSPYAVLRQMRGRYVIHPMPRRGNILTGSILILQKSCVIFDWAFAQMVLRRTVSTIMLFKCRWVDPV
ncbi:UNVERIFIED_CONTAM: hypothetical protein Scaly_2956500 [Sesamum calycinum]|uniref:Uncharacterized protein n=1 Tax=Sesamum calycinum TaxID=2727403 RepID=A0AAW2KX38_9LAMI